MCSYDKLKKIKEGLVCNAATTNLVVHPDVKSVVKEPVVEEPVGQEERDEDNDQVQELTEDETEVVDVVLVVDVVGEKLGIYE